MGGPTAPTPARLAPASGGYSLRPDDPGVVATPRRQGPPTNGAGLVDSSIVRFTNGGSGPHDELDAPTARGTAAPQAPRTTSPSSPPANRSSPTLPPTSRTTSPTLPARPGRISSSPVAPSTTTSEPVTSRTSTARGPAVARTSTARRTQELVAARTLLVEQGADYFTLLGVPVDASPDAVRAAYLNLAKQLHPDKLAELGMPDDQGAVQRLFAHIGNAFAVLTDPVRRQTYLDGLARAAPPPGLPRTKTGELPDNTPAAQAAQAVKRAELALKGDRPGEAVNELLRACELQPNNFDIAGLLAWAKFCASSDKLAAASEARKPLERALLRSDTPEVARFYLGRIERIIGRDREALRHFQEVLDLVPNHPEAAAEVRAIEGRLAASRR